MSGKDDGFWDSFNGTIDVGRASYDADYKAGLNSSYGSLANNLRSAPSSSPDFTSSVPDYSISVGSSSGDGSLIGIFFLGILLFIGYNYFFNQSSYSMPSSSSSQPNSSPIAGDIRVFSGTGLNVRSEPGVIKKSNIIGNLTQRDKVKLLGQTKNIDGNQWLYIETIKYQGWARDDLLDGFEDENIRSVSGAGLNVRSAPGIIDKNNIIGVLVPKTRVKVLGETKNVNGSQWLHIETIPYQGWINGKLLTP